MKTENFNIVLVDYERRIIVKSLNQMRNQLKTEGRYVDAVDELLLKLIDAKPKKFKFFKEFATKNIFMMKAMVYGTNLWEITACPFCCHL